MVTIKINLYKIIYFLTEDEKILDENKKKYIKVDGASFLCYGWAGKERNTMNNNITDCFYWVFLIS